MRVSPWVELAVSLLGVALTIPYLAKVFADEFPTGKYHTWLRIIPQAALAVTAAVATVAVLRTKESLYRVALGLDVGTTLLTVFLLVFSSQSPTYIICDEYNSLCIDYETSVCTGTNIGAGEAFTWLIGICLMLIATGFWLRTLAEGIQSIKVSPS